MKTALRKATLMAAFFVTFTMSSEKRRPFLSVIFRDTRTRTALLRSRSMHVPIAITWPSSSATMSASARMLPQEYTRTSASRADGPWMSLPERGST